MWDKYLLRIFDDLLQEIADKDAEIVRSEFVVVGLLTPADGTLINDHTLFMDKFAKMFRLLKAKDAKLVFRKLQEICVKQKWRDLLKTVQSKLESLESVRRTEFILTVHEQQKIHMPFTYDLPRSIQLFVGREEELSELNKLLNSNLNSKLNSCIKVVISGLGGVGKTQLVLRYIKDYCHEYDCIIWINSESEASTTESFTRLAETLRVINVSKDIKTIVNEVYRKLSQMEERSLIIFDNADDFIPEKFWPGLLDKFFVLITSRNQDWPHMLNLKLHIFKDQEAIDFIKRSLSSKNYDSDNEVISLVNMLHNFPLALQQAVAYIKQNHDEEQQVFNDRFTISDYLKEYENSRRKLLNYNYFNENNELNVITTLNTWTVTVDKLKTLAYNTDTSIVKQDALSMTDALQIKILHLISYMNSDKIDPYLFIEVAKKDKKHLRWAVSKLHKYSMIFSALMKDSDIERVFLNVHKLVQQVTRLRLDDDGQEEQTFRIVFMILQENFPRNSRKLEDIAKSRELLPHLAVLKSEIENFAQKKLSCQLQELQEYKRVQKDYLHNLLGDLSFGYDNIGNPSLKKDCCLQLLLIQHMLFGYGNCTIAKTLSELGNAIGDLGCAKTKKILLERAIKIQETQCGSDFFEIAVSLNNLAIAHGQLGNPKLQKDLIERALKITERHNGPDHYEVAIVLVNLANAYGQLGDQKTKKVLLERAVKIQESHLGFDHFEVAKTLTNLANAHGQLGDLKMKMTLLERALKIEEKHFGPDHFEVSKILTNLANVKGDTGDLKTQKILLQRALKIKEHHYGCDHFEIVTTLTNLAIAHGQLGDSKMQTILLERALQIEEKQCGHDHLKVGKILVNLGAAYSCLGDWNTEKLLLERALKIMESHYGTNHFEVAKTLTNLANAHGQLGDTKTQIVLLERALKIGENHFGPDHFELDIILISLANTCLRLGNLKMHDVYTARALKIQKMHGDSDNFESILSSVKLAYSRYLSSGLIRKSTLELFEKFLALTETKPQPDHPFRLEIMSLLAKGYKILEDPTKEAEVLFKYYLLQFEKYKK